jgi:transcriptional regulator with XRE-family HTH domain
MTKTLAERIKLAREEAGYSIMEAAKKAGLSADLIRNWERGTSSPSVERLSQLGKVLGVSFGGDAATTKEAGESIRQRLARVLFSEIDSLIVGTKPSPERADAISRIATILIAL